MRVFIGSKMQEIPLDNNGIKEAERIYKTNKDVLIQFTDAEDKAMAKLQRMANNPDPQEHPSQADMDLLEFYNKYE